MASSAIQPTGGWFEMDKRISISGRTLRLSNLTKRLWPQYTKAQLVEYYALIAPYLLPYLHDRPISLVRYPDGITGKYFYQKNRPPGTPNWVKTHPVRSADTDKVTNYLLINDLATLLWVVNLAAIELNPWHSRATTPDQPDWAVIDLDPTAPAGFPAARQAALLLKQVLDDLSLTAYPKLSGATGIHVYLPLPAGWSHRDSVTLTGFLGKILLTLNPALITTERLVKNRGAKVYVDHLQNLAGQTIVAPFSLRPTPEATISMPVTWAELETVEPTDFTLGNYRHRLPQLATLPFAAILARPPAATARRLNELLAAARSAEFDNITRVR